MAYPIDAALSQHYEQYEWTLYNSDYDTLEWSEKNAIPKPTKEDLESKLAVINAAEPMRRLRLHRDRLLQEVLLQSCQLLLQKISPHHS